MKIIIYLVTAIILTNLASSSTTGATRVFSHSKAKSHSLNLLKAKAKAKTRTQILPTGAPYKMTNEKLFEPCYKDLQCISTDERAEALLCDTSIMECRSKTRCQTSRNCFHNNRCENSFCKSKDVCQNTNDCASERICVKGQCKLAGAVCSNDRTCPNGQYCQKGVCTALLPQPCYIDDNCNKGSFCYEGKCIRQRNKKCIADAHCKDGFKCYYDKCRQRCETSYDCPLSNACEPDLKICKLPSAFGCIKDKECPIGKVCRLGKCRDLAAKVACALNSECKAKQICQGNYCLSQAGGPCAVFNDCVDPLKCGDDKKCYDPSILDDIGLHIPGIVKDKERKRRSKK